MGSKTRGLFVAGIVLFIIAGILSGVLMSDGSAKQNAAERAETALLSAANEHAATISAVLFGQFSSLDLLSSIVNKSESTDAESLNASLGESLSSSDISRVFIFSSDGISVNTANLDVADRYYFKKSMTGQRAMEYVLGRTSHKTGVMLSVPWRKNGAIKGVIAGIYYDDDLRTLLNREFYNSDGLFYIADSTGYIIATNDVSKSASDGLNVSAYALDKALLDTLSMSAKSKESHIISFHDDGDLALAAYVPLSKGVLPENDWFVLRVLTRSEFDGEVRKSRNVAVGATALFAVCSLAALTLFLALNSDNKKRLRKESEKLRRREEQFRIVAMQSGKSVFRYDIATDTSYSQEGNPSCGFIENNVTRDFVTSTIEKGYVAEQNAREFKEFFKRVAAGENIVSGVFLLREKGGEYSWFKLDSTTLFDDDGKCQSAIISYCDYSKQRELEMVYAKWQQEINRLSADNVAIYEWNMTKDICESERGTLVENYSSLKTDSFNSRTERYSSLHLFSEDLEEYRQLMNRENLVEAYNNGIYTKAMEYRYIASGGGIYWRRISVQLVQHPMSQDIKAYIINESVDKARRAELDIIESAKIDQLTGALNRAIFTRRVEDLIENEKDSSHAFFMLDIDSFKQVNDTMGHDVGDQTLSELIGHARQVLRCNDTIGRLGGDEFMIVIKGIPDEALAEQIANRLCAGMRIQLTDDLLVSVSIGIAIYPRDGKTFDELYKNADAALYHVKQSGKGGHCFYASLGNENYQPFRQGEDKPAPVIIPEAYRNMRVFFIGGTETEHDLLARSLGDNYTVEHVRYSKRVRSYMLSMQGKSAIVIVDMGLPRDDVKEILGIASEMRDDTQIITIALIPENEPDFATEAVEYEFDGYIFRPIGDSQLAPLLRAIITKSRNEQIRYRENIIALKQANDERYWRLLSASGVAAVTIDWNRMRFEYSEQIKSVLAGTYDERPLWQIFTSDGVAGPADVKKIRNAVVSVADNKTTESVVKLRVKSGEWHEFRFMVNKSIDKSGVSVTVTLAFLDINDEMLMLKELETKAQRDMLTGLYNREYFIERMAQMTASHAPGYYIISCFDIDSFKTINDQYGTNKGDEVLKAVAAIFKREFDGVRAIACRVSADNFAVLYPKEYLNTQMPERINKAFKSIDSSISGVSYSTGRYLIDDLSIPVSAMYDRARIARQSIKGRYDTHVAVYDESMRVKILREQSIISEMDAALKQGQFELWLQPQFNHATSALIGAEALVRWRHPQKGVLTPGAFIQVFERTGFIYEMDKYIWTKACVCLRKWLDEGIDPLPISVNVSRYDIFRDDFFTYITSAVEAYDVPVDLLRLEITESAFAKDTSQIIEMVKRLRKYGFTIEIDDFGSGYSSFNTLKEVPANILKLDMRLLDGKGNSQRGGNILESIVRMAKWLGMPVIAEGVETKGDADFLKSIGCFYIQGYLYARPMPVEDFDRLRENRLSEHKLSCLETINGLDNNVFWDPKSMETLIFNSYIGGACIYEYHNGEMETLRVNDKYAQILGGGDMSIERAIGIKLADHMDAKGVDSMKKAFELAISSNDEANFEALLTALPGKRESVYIRMGVKLLANSVDRCLIYCTIDDLTAQWTAETRERESYAVRQAIMDNVGSGIIAVVLNEGSFELLFANDKFFSQLGYSKEQYGAEVGSLLGAVVDEDRKLVENNLLKDRDTLKSGAFTFRAKKRDGSRIWLQSNISLTTLPGLDKPVLLDVVTDITAQKDAEQAIVEKSEQLYFLSDTSRDLLGELDTNDAINEVLNKLINYFGANRAYIFELIDNGSTASNTYEVCKAGVTPEMDNLKSVPISSFSSWFDIFGNRNHLEIADVNELGQDRAEEKRILAMQNINSLAAVSLRRDGKLIGFVGVDDPSRNFSHVKSLEALGDYIAVILTRRDLNRKIESDYSTLVSLMNDTPCGFVRMRILPGGAFESIFINDGFCRMVGMPADEVMSRSKADAFYFIHPDDVPRMLSSISLILATNTTFSANFRIAHEDKRYLWTMVFARISAGDTGAQYCNLYYADITDQMNFEQICTNLLDNMPYGAAMFEYDGVDLTPIYINRRYRELVGRDESLLLRSRPSDAVHPIDRSKLFLELQSALAQNRDIDTTLRILRGEADYINLRVKGSIIKPENGKPTIYVSYFPEADGKRETDDPLDIPPA